MPNIRRMTLAERIRKRAASKRKKTAILKMKRKRERFTRKPTFRDVVRNVWRDSQSSGYDPATGTNWCHMPMEIRMKCIESMNFRTRACLRGTSTTEKALVESKKYDAKMFSMNCFYFTLTSHLEGGQGETTTWNRSKTREESRKMVLQLKLILKLCQFHSFIVKGNNILEPADFLEKVPINCDRLEIGDVEIRAVMFFLKNCRNGVESIEFCPASCLPLYDIVFRQSVLTAESVTFIELDCACHLDSLLNAWMALRTTKVGTKLRTESRKGVVFQPVVAHYGHLNVSEDVTSIRLLGGSYNRKDIMVTRESDGNFEMVTFMVIEPEPRNDINSDD